MAGNSDRKRQREEDEEAGPAKKPTSWGQLLPSFPFKVNVNFHLPDVTNGLEKFLIPCFNWLDEETLPPFKYISTCSSDINVSIPTEEGFMVRCDCKDGCLDATTCPCQRLTRDEGMGLTRNRETPPTGYADGKLPSKVVSGVYECNQYCTCSSCSNRIVQFGIQQELMVYKTEKMGWGVMSLKDIPQGTFVCCYVGQICTDDTADTRGIRLGDNYMAELDYIEVVELIKEGYESDVESFHSPSSSQEDLTCVQPNTDDNSFYVVPLSPSPSLSLDDIIQPLSSPSLSHTNTQDHSTISDSELSSCKSSSVLPSCRYYYNEGHCYIIDAQRQGNIARFLNHSCSPNLFVQNVFVNSHDLRFPWVAFFAKTTISAYTELCWDYNYVIGSVEGKEIPCYCGSVNCRKRLL